MRHLAVLWCSAVILSLSVACAGRTPPDLGTVLTPRIDAIRSALISLERGADELDARLDRAIAAFVALDLPVRETVAELRASVKAAREALTAEDRTAGSVIVALRRVQHAVDDLRALVAEAKDAREILEPHVRLLLDIRSLVEP